MCDSLVDVEQILHPQEPYPINNNNGSLHINLPITWEMKKTQAWTGHLETAACNDKRSLRLLLYTLCYTIFTQFTFMRN